MVLSENISRINGDRIFLSLFRTDDESAAKYARWMSDEAVSANIELSGRIIDTSFMASWLTERDPYRMGIVEKSSGELVGYCHIDHRPLADAAWLSINIGEPDARGKGYGTEVVKLLNKFAFEELGVESIHLDVLESNAGAIRVYEKCGFKLTGRYRKHYIHQGRRLDWLHMDIIREEWEALNNVRTDY